MNALKDLWLSRQTAWFAAAVVAPASLVTNGQQYWDPAFGQPGIPEGAGAVATMAWFQDKLLIGGRFSRVGGVQATNVALWNGHEWSPLGDGLGVYDEERPSAASVVVLRVIDNEVYAAGHFTNSGPMAVTNIAQWTGSSWAALGGNLTLKGEPIVVEVTDLAGRSASDMYVCGNFDHVASTPARGIAHWDGVQWLPLGSGVSQNEGVAFIAAMTLTGDELYVGGSFSIAGGVAATNVAKWTGSRWESMGSGLGPTNRAVFALAFNGGLLYAGGNFGHGPDLPVQGMARWDGSSWTAVGGSLEGSAPNVRSLSALGGGVLIGGEFDRIGGVPATNIAAWSGSQWIPLDGGLHRGAFFAEVSALTSGGSEIYAGGYFSFAGDLPSMNIARWQIPRTLKLGRRQNEIRVSWPAADSNLVLQVAGRLPETNWVDVAQVPVIVQSRLTVTNQITSPNAFFRLKERTTP